MRKSTKPIVAAALGCATLIGFAVPQLERRLSKNDPGLVPAEETVVPSRPGTVEIANSASSLDERIRVKRVGEVKNVSDAPILYGIFHDWANNSALEAKELYSFHAAEVPNFQREIPKVTFMDAVTASFLDDKLYCFNVGTVNVIEVKTGKILHEDLPLKVGDEALVPLKDSSVWDPATGKFYMLYWSIDGTFSKALLSYNPKTGAIEEIGNLSDWGFTLTMAISPEGKLYTIMFGDPTSSLVEIDKTTAQCTTISDDIFEGDSLYNYGLHSVASTFDFSDGMMYVVGGSNKDNQNYVYRIDPKTGKGVKIGKMPEQMQFIALSVAKADHADAPGFASEIEYVDGTLKFTAPTMTYSSKKNLSGSMTAYVKVRGGQEYTKSVTPGEKVSMDLPLPSGQSIIEISVGNTSGIAPFRRLSVVVDDDVPGPVNDLQINQIGATNEVRLNWTKPTTSVHGGVFKDEDVRYRITRYPDKTVVSESQAGTSFVDRVPETHAHYYYGITSLNIDREGDTAYSDHIIYGSVWEAPYKENFDTQEDFDYFTVIDGDSDGNTWRWDGGWSTPRAQLYYGSSKDYLRTPKINMKKDIEYFVSLKTFLMLDPSEVEILVGKNPEIKGGEQVVGKAKIEAGSEPMMTFHVDSNGVYYLFFHITSGSEGNMDMDWIDFDVYSLFSAPAAVENLNVKAGEKGAINNTIKFNAPTKTFEGKALNNISRIEIYRNDLIDPVKVFENVTPGSVCEWTDEEVRQGNVTYKIIPYNESGRGQFVKNTNWVGLDMPADVTNLKAWMNDDALCELTFDKAAGIGMHGGYVDPEAVTYVLYRYDPEYWGVNWLALNEPTKDLHFIDDTFKLKQGNRQESVSYKIIASNKAGDSEGKSFSIILGKPYKSPYTETFANCTTDKGPWCFDGSMFPQPWSFVDGIAMAVKPYDSDKGMMQWKWINEDSTIGMTRGPRVNLTTIKNPELSFMMWHGMEAEPEDLSLLLYANYDDQGWKSIGEVPYNNGMAGWGRYSVALEEGHKDVQFGFGTKAVDASAAIYIDLIKVDKELEKDIVIQSINIAANRVEAGDPVKITACVSNYGVKAADNYTVSLRRDNNVIQTKEGTSLKKSNDMVFYTFEIPTSKTDAKATMTFDVVVSLDGDQNEDNNRSNKVSAYIHGTPYPAPTALVGELKEGTGVMLSWDKPAETSIPVETVESFEDYESFVIEDFGGWVTYDGDGEPSMYLSTPAVPNSFEPQAWQVWAPEEAGVSTSIFPTLAPRTGDKVLVCWGASDDKISSVPNEDWLISPEVKGGSDISFYYRQPLELYAPAKFEILYSTTDQDPIEFEVIGSGEVEDNSGYYHFEFTLPDDAKYFAIKSCSTDNYFAALLDDLSYTPLEGATKELTLVGYNVYRNGEKIADGVKETKYTDNGAVGDVVYHVSAVWKEGESNPFGPCSLSAEVNDNMIDTSVFVKTLPGAVYVKSAYGTDLVICSVSGVAVFNSHVESDAIISLEPGVYVLNAGGKTYKVIVR